jgi:Domain of unknown function (DUF4342)
VPVDLASVDLVRDRIQGASYAQAQQALEATNGDVVAALARLEQSQSAGVDLAELTAELMDDVGQLLEAGGAIRTLRVKIGDRVLREVPVTVGAVGAVLIGLLAVLASRLTIDILRDDS